MLNMKNLKDIKFRNPFPSVFKVFKYEMISVARKILPVYAVLVALSLIIGVFVMDSNLEIEPDGQFGFVKTIIIMLAVILFSVMVVILISIIARRYKKSILGDEAYLNLTLPVSIGEHLCGRYLANFVWSLSYAVISIISVLFVFIRGWPKAPKAISEFLEKSAEFKLQHGFGFGYIFWNSLIHAVLFFMLICVFIYTTETLIHMLGKHRTLTAVMCFCGIFTIYHNIAQLIFKGTFVNAEDSVLAMRSIIIGLDIYDIVYIVILSCVTRLLLTYKLNLE